MRFSLRVFLCWALFVIRGARELPRSLLEEQNHMVVVEMDINKGSLGDTSAVLQIYKLCVREQCFPALNASTISMYESSSCGG